MRQERQPKKERKSLTRPSRQTFLLLKAWHFLLLAGSNPPVAYKLIDALSGRHENGGRKQAGASAIRAQMHK
jgi:hypothetical protein